MSDFASLAHERYSCRAFSDKPVEPELIEKIIDVALAAPLPPSTNNLLGFGY